MPAKDTLSVDDFTMEYYGVDDVAGVEGVTRQWAPIEGGEREFTYLSADGCRRAANPYNI